MTTRAEQAPKTGADPQADVDRLAGRLIVGYIPLWTVGLAGLYWPLLLLALLPRLVRARLNGPALASASLFLVLLLSIPVGALTYGVDASRVVSAVGNGTIWLGLAALFALRPGAEAVARGLGVLVVFQGVLIVAAAAIFPMESPLPLLHDSMGWAPSGVAMMASNSLFFVGWLGDAAFRSVGIMGNPTWCGALGAVGVLIALDRLRGAGTRRSGLVLLAAGMVALVLSLSRASVGALGIALAVAAMMLVGRRHAHLAVLMGLVTAAVALVMFVGAWGTVVEAVEQVNDQRSGSLTTRSAIYAETWRGISEHPAPLLGYGVKPQEEALVASVASHSTYLGLLYRMGLAGLLLFVGLLAALLLGALKWRDPLGAAITVFTLVWCVLEDFDTGHVVPLALLVAAAGANGRRFGSRDRVHNVQERP